jgi:hypothetical protein
MLIDDPINILYHFYIEISVNLRIQSVSIKGSLLRNGIPIFLRTTNKIHMNLSLSANLNRYISPLQINIHPKLGSLYLSSGAYIEINTKNFEQFYL